MPLHTTEAFVLRTYPLAEADKICVFLSKDIGKARGVAHGARKMRSRFGSALEPFTEVAITYYHKEGRELVSLSSCDILRSHFHRGARDVESASAFSYMAELLVEFLPDQEPNERLYRLVSATLEAIESGCEMAIALRYFESWLLRLGGFFPETAQCVTCGDAILADQPTFLSAAGAPRCEDCSGGKGPQVSPATRLLFGEVFRLHPLEFARQPLEPANIAQMANINYHIIRHALERDLRSRAAMLRQTDA